MEEVCQECFNSTSSTENVTSVKFFMTEGFLFLVPFCLLGLLVLFIP